MLSTQRQRAGVALTCALALVFALSFGHAYVSYISPVYEYARYLYFPASMPVTIAVYMFAVVPCLFMRWTEAPSSYGISLLYALCYVPTQLMLLFNWNGDSAELLVVEMSLALSMSAFMAFAGAGWRPTVQTISEDRLGPIMSLMMVISLTLLVWAYRDHMRFVGFDDVYDLRFETSAIDTGPVVDYFVSWLSYCFLPFYLARGILNKRGRDVLLAVVAAVLIYSSTGAKAMILMPPIMLFMYTLLRARQRLLPVLLAVLSAAVYIVSDVMSDEGLGFWAKFIFLIRVLCAGGWANSTYYEFFTQNGLTYYSHIGFVNSVTGMYPYGKYSLGQTIGLEYSGSELANFNASFWASDGFAALGLAGIPLITLVVLAVFYAINRVSSPYSARFVTLWLAGFWLGLLNLPLSTAFVSAGGGLTLLLLWFTAQFTTAKNRTTPMTGPPEPPHPLSAQVATPE